MPQVAKPAEAYLVVSDWGSLSFGVGQNDHFNDRASFLPEMNPNGDGSWSLKSMADS